MEKSKQYKLKVGETAVIKRGLFSYSRVSYGGMPNGYLGETYSLVHKTNLGEKGWAYNLYFPKAQKEIDPSIFDLRPGRLKVVDVDPEQIILEYIREWDK